MGLQGTEDVGAAIAASDADMAALDGRNDQADQISQTVRVILRVVVGPLTTQREVGTCCYLLHLILRTQCHLVEAPCSQVVDALDENFSLFALHMATSHCCMAFSTMSCAS